MAAGRAKDFSFNTAAKAVVDAGKVSAQMHDELVQGVTSRRIPCNEIWPPQLMRSAQAQAV